MAALAVAAALVAGCTDGGDDTDGGPDVTVPDDTLRLGIGGSLVVDPAEASLASASDLMVLDLLHDGLTRLDEDGVAQPALAQKWAANPALTTFDFVLSPNARFASGRAVTPRDVVASLERVMAAGDASLSALSLEVIKGFSEFAQGKAEHVSGLKVAAPNTVRIEMAVAQAQLPIVLSSPVMSVVDPETIEGDLADLDLSGAWSVSSAEDDALQLESRDDAAGLRRVALLAYDDRDGAYDAFEDGEVDWAEVPSAQHDDAVEEHGDQIFAVYQAELFFGLNVNASALKSDAMRQAIALAIDRQSIVEEVYADLGDPLTTVVPAGIEGYDPERCPDCGYDPEEAVKVVKATFPDGKVPLVHIDFDESPVQEAMAEMVADDLDDAGIPTELRPKPLDEYKAFVVSGEQELFSFGWIGAYRSPDAYLAPLFSASANDNLTNFRSPGVDLALAAARGSTDAGKNAKGWAAAEKAVLEADVVVPIVQFRTQAVVSERVQGFAHAVDGSVDWTKVSLEG